MAKSTLFLSHIHEERDLAILIKGALEQEFAGFVDVFVSSDGTSIPAGANFLKRIEDSLISCVGALYLLSKSSVMRPWINFELGAVWIRNAVSNRSSGPEIPALPICHSGLLVGALPAPLNNLNAIQANQSDKLEFAFKSIQNAVGGSGGLRTDFDLLAGDIVVFENNYTIGIDLKRLLLRCGVDIKVLVTNAIAQTPSTRIVVDLGRQDQAAAHDLMQFIDLRTLGKASYATKGSGTVMSGSGVFTYVELEISILASLIQDVQKALQ